MRNWIIIINIITTTTTTTIIAFVDMYIRHPLHKANRCNETYTQSQPAT